MKVSIIILTSFEPIPCTNLYDYYQTLGMTPGPIKGDRDILRGHCKVEPELPGTPRGLNPRLLRG